MRNILSSIILLTSLNAVAQQNPPVLSQYNFNPFVFNPAYVGDNGYQEATAYYKYQNLNVDGSPSTLGVTYQYPYVIKGLSLGVKGFADFTNDLTNQRAMISASYQFALKNDHSLSIGFSAGSGQYRVRKEGNKIIDNIQSAGNSAYVAADFGVHYKYKKFDAGISFPSLFTSQPYGEKNFAKTKLFPFGRKQFNVSYLVDLGKTGWGFQPTILVQDHDERSGLDYDLLLRFNYKENAWVGVALHHDAKPSLFCGEQFKRLRIGYAYDLTPLRNEKVFLYGSHELQVAWRFGEKGKLKCRRIACIFYIIRFWRIE